MEALALFAALQRCSRSCQAYYSITPPQLLYPMFFFQKRSVSNHLKESRSPLPPPKESRFFTVGREKKPSLTHLRLPKPVIVSQAYISGQIWRGQPRSERESSFQRGAPLPRCCRVVPWYQSPFFILSFSKATGTIEYVTALAFLVYDKFSTVKARAPVDFKSKSKSNPGEYWYCLQG